MDGNARSALRLRVLRELSGDSAAIEEVARYCESPFRTPNVAPPVFPMAPEPHVEDWRRYIEEAGPEPFAYLQQRLPQLNIPIREGISKIEAYGEVVRRGRDFVEPDFGGRLELRRPQTLRLYLHEHPAGALPVLATPDREDFEALFRAVACRSEPFPVSPSVNAQIIAGFVNWDRVERHRREWAARRDPLTATLGWPREMARVAAEERWRFHDRFVLTCVRPYSAVSAAELGLDMEEEVWLQRSTDLRVEHEFTHYATKRVYSSMSLNLLDETIADCMGASFAMGGFRADWFLRFLGLEAWPEVRESGRVHTYATELSPGAFELACAVTVKAARGLERIAGAFYSRRERGRFLLALAPLTLELLAAPEAEAIFAEAWEQAGRLAGAVAGDETS